MSLHKDPSTWPDRARVVDTKAPGKVIYRSDFDGGKLDGWIDHWSGFRPWPVVSITSAIQLRGSHCLMLSTNEDASPVTGDPSNSPAVFKRLYRHDEYRYHHLSAWLAVGYGGFTSAVQSFALYVDTNNLANTVRSFFQLSCDLSRPGPAFARWQVQNDSAALVTVGGTDGLLIGGNENKQGFEYVRLTVDLAANGGLGGYKEFQVGGTVTDLTAAGGGSALTAPQFDSPTGAITDFRGGFNIGLALARRTDIAGGGQLFADDIVYSVSNT